MNSAGGQVPFYFSRRARFVDQLSLVAVDSAVGIARNFVKLTLGTWRARTIIADAALIVSELVTNAVKATGVLQRNPPWSDLGALDLVFVRILGLDARPNRRTTSREGRPPGFAAAAGRVTPYLMMGT